MVIKQILSAMISFAKIEEDWAIPYAGLKTVLPRPFLTRSIDFF
jgi:hypothetical protein